MTQGSFTVKFFMDIDMTKEEFEDYLSTALDLGPISHYQMEA